MTSRPTRKPFVPARESSLPVPSLPVRRIPALLTPGLLVALLWGCGSSSTTTGPKPNHSPARLVLSPDSAEVKQGNQLGFRATVQDSGGNTVTGVDVHWLSPDTSIAQVDSTGRVSGVSLGSIQLEARTATLKARAHVTVVSGLTSVIRVDVFPPAATLLAGDEQAWLADPRDAAGFFVPTGVAWSTDNPDVATVDSLGALRASGPGTTTLRARSGTVTGTAQISVLAGAMVTTLAGSVDSLAKSVDGPALTAVFEHPVGIAVDSLGAIYITDNNSNSVRAIENGVVRTIAGGQERGLADSVGPYAQFDNPVGIAVAPGRRLIVADRGDSHIRQVLLNGMVTTIAGLGGRGYVDGPLGESSFDDPAGLAVGPSGEIYVGDIRNHVVRKIFGGTVSTVAGIPGQAGLESGTPGLLEEPVGLAVGPGSILYIADRGDHASSIRKLALGSGILSTVSGNGFPGFFNSDAGRSQFHNPFAVAVARDGWLYVADPESRRIRAISPTGAASTLCGDGHSGANDGPAERARLGLPVGLCFLPSGELVVVDAANRNIRKIQGTLHLGSPTWPQWAIQRIAVRPQMRRILVPSVDPTLPRR